MGAITNGISYLFHAIDTDWGSLKNKTFPALTKKQKQNKTKQKNTNRCLLLVCWFCYL